MTRARFLIATGSFLLVACGRKKAHIASIPPTPTPSAPPSPGEPTEPELSHPRRPVSPPPYPADSTNYIETGVASWYGHPYHGRPSASGEIYDMEQMTAAHRTLPFGARVLVEDLDNGKTTTVRINDRGPFIDNRIIDLSHAAARDIDMIGPGVAHVRITVVEGPPVPEPAVFAIQVAAFANRDNADRMKARLTARYGAVNLRFRDGTPPLWRVLVGHAPSTAAAEELALQIRTTEDVREAFVVRLDPAKRRLTETP